MADLTPEEREKIYLEEKARFEARKELEQQEGKQQQKSQKKKSGEGFLKLFLLVVILFTFRGIYNAVTPLQNSRPSKSTQIISPELKANLVGQVQSLIDIDPMALSVEFVSEKILNITVSDDWYTLPNHLKERYAKSLSDRFANIRIKVGIAQNTSVDYPTIYIEDLNGKEVAKSSTFGVKIHV